MSGESFRRTPDGFVQRLVFEGGKLWHEWHDAPGRRELVLAENERARRENPARTLDWGKLALRIPVEDYAELRRRNPSLAAADATERTRAWRAFIASPESAPYRVS